MPMPWRDLSANDLLRVAERVRDTVGAAASEALARGAARLELRTVGPAPEVALRPSDPAAAHVTVLVEGERSWWLRAGEGPEFEFYKGMRGDPHVLLGRLIESVVAGDYEHRLERRARRSVWIATFGSGSDAVTTEHHSRPTPADVYERRRFAAY
jgi:hypothetical protein